MSIFVLVLIIGHCFAFLINEKVNVQLSSSSKISEKKKRNLDQFPRRQLIQRITTIIIFLLQEISLILSGVVIIISHHLYPRVFDIWRRRIFMALLDPPPPHPYESWYFFFFFPLRVPCERRSRLLVKSLTDLSRGVFGQFGKHLFALAPDDFHPTPAPPVHTG